MACNALVKCKECEEIIQPGRWWQHAEGCTQRKLGEKLHNKKKEK